MAYNIPWVEVDDNPTKSNQASDLDVYVRKVPDAIAERLVNMFSGFAQGETAEGIKRLEFIDQASDPADNKTIYTKGGEAYLKDGVGNIVQLTLNGVTNPPFDNVTIERVAEALQVKGLGVTEAKLAAGAVTEGKVNSAIKDPAAGTAGLRTLGTGTQQAKPGNYVPPTHIGDVTGGTALTIANAVVSQAKLKTSIGSVSGAVSGNLVLPGGQYGFYPQSKGVNLSARYYGIQIAKGVEYTVYTTSVYFAVEAGYTSADIYIQQRYVTASGEVFWIFILRNKNTKDIIDTYQAPDHPCFGNGGKPLLMPHPFGSYDPSKHEIIVINPPLADIEKMELETIVDDETKPDKCLLQIISENYEIDENSNPAWPNIPVTVGLPKHIKDKKTGKKTLADYRFMPGDTIIEPVKKRIVKPDYIKVKLLKRKK